MRPMRSTSALGTSALGSGQGIRWLLAVGSLVTAVSIYRLVASQWASLSVVLQFATLWAATMGVFGASEILRNRLRLPVAGAALGWLFAVLVPVLSWGAAYLELLSTASGAIAFALSLLTGLAALHRVLNVSLRYEGLSYPAAFGLLTASLPIVAGGGDTLVRSGLVAVALGLGLVLFLGARHMNRFLFHRDRRDGIDRPVHALPFLALVVLFVASSAVLPLPRTFAALPIWIVGAVLVATGEEYYRALVHALGRRPSSWPARSVPFLATGFALLAVSVPLGFADTTRLVPAMVLGATAVLLFRWAFRYDDSKAHVAAMLAAAVGYPLLPALLPEGVNGALVELSRGLGLADVFGRTAFAGLGLAALFTALARRGGRVTATASAVHLIALVGLSTLGAGGAKLVAPLALALAIFSAWRRGRDEWLVAAQAALGTAVLAWGGAYGMEVLAVVLLGIAAATPQRFVGASSFFWPAFFWAAVVGASGLSHFDTGGAFEVLLAGLVSMALGHRLRLPAGILVGIGAFSLGLHGTLALAWHVPRGLLSVTTFALFAACLVVSRLSSERWSLASHVAMLGHGALALAWLLLALETGEVTVEPLVVALFGWAFLRHGLKAAGVALLVMTAPFHLWAVGLVSSVSVFLLLTLAGLLVARYLAPALTERLVGLWRVAAVAAALVLAGSEAAALALGAVLVAALEGKRPYRSSLLVLMHGAVVLSGAKASFLPIAFAEASLTSFPLMAWAGLVWLGVVDLTAHSRELRTFRTLVEAGLVFGFLAVVPVGAYGAWEHGALIALALVAAAGHARAGFSLESTAHAWMMQAWTGLAVIEGIYAGFLSFGTGRAPYVLIAAGALQYGLGLFFEWREARDRRPLARSAFAASQVLMLLGGAVALARAQAVPPFLASLGFLVLASRQSRRITPAVLAAVFLGGGLLCLAWTHGAGSELYSLAPGFTLVALSLLLSRELGPRFQGHVFTAGASFIYATPVLALYDEITWMWQAVLLILTVVFGAASFWLRSRPLLTLSTAALVVDLACFVVKIRATEPLLLWVFGLAFGIGLIGLAAYLEYRREGLAQRIRVFGRELAHWY